MALAKAGPTLSLCPRPVGGRDQDRILVTAAQGEEPAEPAEIADHPALEGGCDQRLDPS